MPNIQERKFITECLQMYRESPSLWNQKSKEYYDRNKKTRAYEKLVEKYREMFPDATRDDVKRKLNALRTNYRKELKKHTESLKSDRVYTPTLWYFGEMEFLRVLESAPDQTTLEAETAKFAKEYKVDINSVEDEDTHESSSTSIVNIPTSSTSYSTPRKKARIQSEDEVECTDLGPRRRHTYEHHHWAMACAADLQKMEPTQQIYAKKAIAEILMEGQLGLLNRNSVRINDPLLKTEEY